MSVASFFSLHEFFVVVSRRSKLGSVRFDFVSWADCRVEIDTKVARTCSIEHRSNSEDTLPVRLLIFLRPVTFDVLSEIGIPVDAADGEDRVHSDAPGFVDDESLVVLLQIAEKLLTTI